MKKYLLSFIIAIFPVMNLYPQSGETALKEKIAAQLDFLLSNFSNIQLADIYKDFYQDNFGPGHLLSDTGRAKNYFVSELDEPMNPLPAVSPTGADHNFYRVNMNLVKDGIIPADQYFKAFVESLEAVEKPSDDQWRAMWALIDSVVSSSGLSFENEQADRDMISGKISSGNFVVHHSDNFNRNNNFHYRIISRKAFDKYLRPLIPADKLNGL